MGLIGCNGILKTRADIEVKPARTGGQSGIRTHGTRKRTPVFKTGSLNRSDICPPICLSTSIIKVKLYLFFFDLCQKQSHKSLVLKLIYFRPPLKSKLCLASLRNFYFMPLGGSKNCGNPGENQIRRICCIIKK